MDLPTSTLRALLAVAESGSVSSAARALGYTQSAVSRQIAAAEHELGHRLFTRSHAGMQPNREGLIFLRYAAAALRALGDAVAEINGARAEVRTVRVGSIPVAGITVLAPALALLARSDPELRVTTRQGSTHSLVRALRSGSLDLAVITEHPPFPAPDSQTPPLTVVPILDLTLLVAVAADGPWRDRESLDADELVDEPWIAGLAPTTEGQLGVWPRLPGRPHIAHRTNDWLGRLHLVAGGAGITTIPGPYLADLVPNIRAVEVTGVPEERRRVSSIRLPGAAPARDIDAVLDGIQLAAERLGH
jgi:DNA-binding transcriptional LysR family regulator